MSTFALNRNYGLELPSNYVDITKEEMEYVDGGANFQKYWWGWALDLSNSECDTMSGLLDVNLCIGGGTAALAAGIAMAFPLVGGSALVAVGLYAMNVGIAKAKLNAAYKGGFSATLCKNTGGYSVNIY